MMKSFYKIVILISLLSLFSGSRISAQNLTILKAADFKHYIDAFNSNDNELYKQYIPNDSAWAFLESNIPFFECPDKNIELTYYFRWWTYRKHIKETPGGFVISEFLPEVNWSGKYNTISCAAAHHFYEGRWLKSHKYLNSYANFWFNEGNPRMYSFWAANSLLEYFKITNDSSIISLLPQLVNNYRAWESGRTVNGHFIGKNPDGLFSSFDDRDGMEMQIGGSGKRPTINSYMYGDAIAISKITGIAGNKVLEKEFSQKANILKELAIEGLWDNEAMFFKTRSEKDDQLVDVRELQGYTPWYFNMPPEGKGYEQAWGLIKTGDGFNAPYGLTTAEQSHPKYTISYSGHECQWNGPVWPYASSITLTALANVLNNYEQNVVTERDFYDQFVKYTLSHRIINDDGIVLPWIDENLNPYTGDWISRTRLKVWKNGTWSDEKGGIERGKDYNHSTYCDILITGLTGIRPQENNSIVINPLIPENSWDWFCIDGLNYKGNSLAVFYDKDGKKYNRGAGFFVYVNGKLKVRKDRMEKIELRLD